MYTNVIGDHLIKLTHLRSKQVLKWALGAIDLAGENRFSAHLHEHEGVRVGQREDGPVKPSQRVVRI